MSPRILALGLVMTACVLPILAHASPKDTFSSEIPAARLAGLQKAPTFAEQVLSANADAASRAVAQLREQGPDGLRQLGVFRDALAKNSGQEAKLAKLDAAMDTVSAQRYGSISRVYWYTDLKQAEAAAAASGKPILSLRLLGNLTDDYSCANSRFFRTTLYSNPEIADCLRENFVLHWQSERPVPKVTFDFGDGRVLRRTLTGNSIHYVLGSDGRVLDALPGLYGPEAFLGWLQTTRALGCKYNAAANDPLARTALLADYHMTQSQRIAKQAENDLRSMYGPSYIRMGGARVLLAAMPAVAGSLGAIPATAAMPRAATKAVVEQPMLARMDVGQPGMNAGGATDQLAGIAELGKSPVADAAWKNIAARHPVEFDSRSMALMRSLTGELGNDSGTDFSTLLQKFQESVALDTVRNEYTLHATLHAWLAEMATEPADLETFNQRVYARLFLTPDSDPWLGLSPDSAFSALPNNGVAKIRDL